MKNKSLLDSFSNALQGVIHAIIHERNFRFHFVVAIFVLFISLLVELTLAEYLIVVLVIALVLITELFNTAVEAVVDLCTKGEYNYFAKIAKDTAAGGVFISAMVSLATGYMLIFKKIALSGFSVETILRIRQTSAHITFVCVILTIMLTVLLKALTKAENFFRGGMPSAHSAMAFSFATCIFFIVDNAFAISIGYFLAALVAQSRVEGKIHSILQVLFGSLLGIFVTALVFQLQM